MPKSLIVIPLCPPSKTKQKPLSPLHLLLSANQKPTTNLSEKSQSEKTISVFPDGKRSGGSCLAIEEQSSLSTPADQICVDFGVLFQTGVDHPLQPTLCTANVRHSIMKNPNTPSTELFRRSQQPEPLSSSCIWRISRFTVVSFQRWEIDQGFDKF